MSLSESFRLAISNIRTGKMRAFLTMLGIIIGVLAVVLIVGIGNGLSQYVTDMFADMGTNVLSVNVMGRGSATRTLDEDQMYEIVAEHDEDFAAISPTVSVNSEAKVGTESLASSVEGVSEDFFFLKGYEVDSGRGISYGDVTQRNQVCVVGAYVNETYYGGQAVGQDIRIGGVPVLIVGVMAAESDTLEEGGTDDVIYLPYSTAARLNGNASISSYSVLLVDENSYDASTVVLENALYDIFQTDSAYMVISAGAMLESMTDMIDVLVYVLAGIAAISLVVGGVGIMNIMLVSVTERTREIGIRKSLGAREKSIMQQFVIEAGIISGMGGVLGIAAGYGLCLVGSGIATSLIGSPFTVTPGLEASLLAFGISVGIGILFGYLPAKRAAVLNPIDALRQ